MKFQYKQDEIIRPDKMSPELLQAYEVRIRMFDKKPREGVKYNGCNVIHYYTIMDDNAHTTFALVED